jgi:hypothetical protein
MTGSGGGGGSYGGGGGGNDNFDCESVNERTPLNSVNREVAATVKVGDVLDVVAQSDTGPLVVETIDSAILGSITSAKLARILDCIRKGFSFVAEIVEVSGGKVVIVLRPE